MREDDFIAQKFHWFTGTVKDIKDPLKLNRVKVRAYGYHKKDIETSKLPWATVMMPTTTASYKGVGGNHHLEVGSWVVGFFRDGLSAQDPIVMGSIATQEDGVLDIPTEAQKENPTNKVYKSQAGHLIEIDNTEDAETLRVTHAKGAVITIDKDNNLSITNSGTTNINSAGAITITSAVKTTIV